MNYPELSLDKDKMLLIMKGSVDEDEGARPMHHFYDPVNKKGLVWGKEWQSSKDWSKDTLAQAGLMNRVTAGTTHSLYSSDSDYSWDRAVYDYVWEDKGRGLEGLGHILHLIQDATVPDHTRNDPHPHVLGEDSPYEDWVRDLGSINVEVNSFKAKPIIFSNIQDYFDNIASYSNNNFFSEDTISNEKYSNPKIKIKDGYLIQNHNSNIYKVAYINNKKDFSNKDTSIGKPYTLKDPKGEVLEGYWTLLSEQAVLNGAGVVKLFFDEVEKEKITKNLYKKNRSWFKKFYDRFEEKIFGVADSLYGISAEYDEFGDPIERAQPKNLQGASAVQSQKDNTIKVIAVAQPVPKKKVEVKTETPIMENSPVTTTTQTPQENINPQSTFQSTPNQAEIDRHNKEVTRYQPGFGGGSVAVPTPAPQSPIITTPASFVSTFATTTITFSGTAEVGRTITQNFSSVSTTTASDGTWGITISGLPQGSTSINFYSTDGSLTSGSTNASLSVDSMAPGFDTFAITECSSSLSSLVCLLGNGNINLAWTSSSTDIVSYSIYKNSIFQSTTNNTTAPFSLANLSNSNFQIVATDSAGNTATSTTKNVRISTNSSNTTQVGYYCPPESSTYLPMNYYTPSSDGRCVYISDLLTSGLRTGEIYKGVVGSSVILHGHSLANSTNSAQTGDADAILGSATQGDNLFIAIFRTRTGPAFQDATNFRSYFTTGTQSGTTTTPHSDYGILEWKYGVAP